MLIRETFATTIQQRIEPVVKVSDRRPAVMLDELSNLVVTPQWEQSLRGVLDVYTDAANCEDEQGIGIWISGFFGSGKSLMMKVLGMLLEGGDLQGQSVHQLFLSRLPANSPDRSDIMRYLTLCHRQLAATAVGGNLYSMIASGGDPLALIAFKLFAAQRGYTHNWPLAWAVEYQIDARGLTEQFRQRACDLSGALWDELVDSPDFNLDQLCQSAADVLPDHFKAGVAAVERAVSAAQGTGIDPLMLVDRLRRWCAARDGDDRRHKLLLQLDEVGQWIASGNANDRTMQVQALAESAAERGEGRIWIAVTAHGDIQDLEQNVQQEYYAKIIKRFASRCKLSNDDISQVVEERLLRKTQAARVALQERFDGRSGDLAELGTLQRPKRVYPVPDAASFALFYPYLPWTVAVIPDVVKGIAQAAGRDEALTGSNRTMIGVVQGAIIETPALLESPVGRLLCLADLYDQLASDVPIETKTDLNQISRSVPAAEGLTPRVARALFLLGKAEHIPTTVENVALALVDSVDVGLAALRAAVKSELDKLVGAGYAKQVGDEYVFLSTQQRTFQDKVRARQQELETQTYELSQALKDYDSEDALRFDRVPLCGREIPLKLEIDGRVVRNPAAHVTLRVYSPFQRTLDPRVGDEAALRQLSTQEPNNLLFRMGEAPGLRAKLALALATNEVADRVIGALQAGGPEQEVARQAKAQDLPEHKRGVRTLLGQAVRGGAVFFRGTTYQLVAGESASAMVRATLAEILPSIYSRFSEVPHRVANEEAAVKAALVGQTSNADLQALGVYRADGTLNEHHPLLSALRGRLPLAEQDQGAINADTLRGEFEKPSFGWDGNCVKVGLALLLRASSCRLLESGKTFTDPSNSEVLQLLTKEARFKSVRVQGVRSELSVQELQTLRGYVEAIYGVRPALVPATLHNLLGEKLAGTAQQAKALQAWATTAQCPLPVEFESGSELVTELANSSTPTVRLSRFLAEAAILLTFRELLETLADYQQQHGARFQELRDFYNRMVNADLDLEELRRFLDDWRAVIRERSVCDAHRWHELTQAHTAAQQAVVKQIAAWQASAKQKLAGIEAELVEQVKSAAVPKDNVASEVERLKDSLQSLRDRVARPNPSLAEMRGILTALTNAELSLQLKLREVRERYEPRPGDSGDGERVAPEKRLRWSEIVGRQRISSTADLTGLLDTVRTAIQAELDQQRTVVLE